MVVPPVRVRSETFHSPPHRLVNEEASIPHPAPLCYSSKVTPEHTTRLPSLFSLFSPRLLFFSYFITLNLSALLSYSVRAPGCCSDTEADSVFRMAENKDSLSYRRSVSITPKPSGHFNQFLPTKDKPSGYVPAPLRKKRAERNEDSRRSWANPTSAEDEGTLTRYCETTHSSEHFDLSEGAFSHLS